MLQEPMMEKLTAMRLLGMVDALKAQEQDPAARELSFLERLGLLIDQQWTWRENQALARRLHSAKLKGACVEEIDYRASRGLDKSVIRALAQNRRGSESRKHFRARALPASARASCLRSGAESLPRWILGAVQRAPRCFAIWPSLAPTAVCAACWPGSAASMCW